MTVRFPWMALLVLAVAAFCFVGGCNTDETDDITSDELPAVDISGSWTGTFTTADAEGDFDFTMTMDANGEVEGINTRLGRFTGDVAGNRFTIDATDFFAVISANGRSMTGTFTDSESGDPASVVATKN
jgi:hypothetical protein